MRVDGHIPIREAVAAERLPVVVDDDFGAFGHFLRGLVEGEHDGVGAGGILGRFVGLLDDLDDSCEGQRRVHGGLNYSPLTYERTNLKGVGLVTVLSDVASRAIAGVRIFAAYSIIPVSMTGPGAEIKSTWPSTMIAENRT